MIYIDTSVLAATVLRTLPGAAIGKCEALLREIAAGQVDACTSALTWDELTWIAGRARGPFDPVRAALVGSLLLELPGIEFLPADDEILFVANGLVDKNGFKPRDAIHTASALAFADGKIATADHGFSARAGVHPELGLEVSELL